MATLWVHGEYTHAKAILPPENVDRVIPFIDAMGPKISACYRFEREGKTYFRLIGPFPRGVALVSSQPEYIFDENGKFVTWCSDPGDMPSFGEKWGADRLSPKLTREEMRELWIRDGGALAPAREG